MKFNIASLLWLQQINLVVPKMTDDLHEHCVLALTIYRDEESSEN